MGYKGNYQEIYIGDLDKKELGKAIYDYYRKYNIEIIYNDLKKYNPSIDRNQLIAEITDEELEILLNTESIKCINGIYFHISFIDDMAIYDENMNYDYLYIIYNLKKQKGLFEHCIFEQLFSKIDEINEAKKTIEITLQELSDEKKLLRPLVEGKGCNPSEKDKKVFEELHKRKWLVDEDMFKCELEEMQVIKKLLQEEEKFFKEQNSKKYVLN